MAARGRGALRRIPSTATLLCALLVTTILAAGCGGPEPLAGTFESDEAAVQAVLDGVARNDGDGLLRMAVSKDEFEDVVWPTLPVSRPEVGMPIDYVWRDSYTKSRGFLAETLQEFGGQRFELVGLDFRGETTDHGSYQVSRKSHLRVRDAEGQERTIRLFGSIIRQNGRSKIYSYIID